MPNIDKVAWLYIVDKKVLGARSKGKIPFYLPGGKREQGETDIHTLTREVKEEFQIDILPDTIKFYGEFQGQAHGRPEGTMVVMRCYFADFTGTIEPDSEIEAIDWLTSADIGTERSTPTDNLILADLKEKGLIL